MVTDDLPDSLTLVSATASQGECTGRDPVVCGWGRLAPSRAAGVTLLVRAEEAGALTNRATVQAAQVDPTPADNTASVTTKVELPPPVFGQSVNVRPVSGTVLVREAGTSQFVFLERPEQVATGSEIDTTSGKVGIAVAAGGGTTRRGTASEGRFLFHQRTRPGKLRGLAVLRLSGPLGCSPQGGKGRRLLVGSGRLFRTVGRYGRATAERRGGARWLTRDVCIAPGRHIAATSPVGERKLATHRRGASCYSARRSRIRVFDPEARRTVAVRRGQRYCVRRR